MESIKTVRKSERGKKKRKERVRKTKWEKKEKHSFTESIIEANGEAVIETKL